MGKESGAEHVCECLLGPGVGGLTKHQVAKSLKLSQSIISEDDDTKMFQMKVLKSKTVDYFIVLNMTTTKV